MIDAPAPTWRPTRRPLYRLAVASILLATAIILMWHSFDGRYARGMFATAPNAMILPRGLLAIWMTLTVAAFVVDWVRPKTAAGDGLSAAIWLSGIFLAGAIALPHIGFAAMTTPVIGAGLIAMGERRVLPWLVATATLGPGLWFLFHHILSIRLPSVLPGGML